MGGQIGWNAIGFFAVDLATREQALSAWGLLEQEEKRNKLIYEVCCYPFNDM